MPNSLNRQTVRSKALSASVALPLSLLTLASLIGCDPKPPALTTTAQNPAATAPAIQAPTPAASTPAPVVTQTPQQRKTQQLITQVDHSFASGEAHYRKGQLSQAKSDFDNAVDMMLASGIDIKTDPQLSDEFNRVLDAINALEMQALKQGNGFAPKEEPTPADVADDVTFGADPIVVAKAKEELTTTKSDLPLVINDYVATYINFFANSQKGHNTLKHSLARSGRYKAMIQRVMTEEGVPQDLIFLAVAESAFQPRVVNAHSGAGGMWQFMPNDKYYGLARNAYVDERFDPEKSTRASAKYMKFIYNQLGDWYLAMAGYNWGTGRVQQAVQKTGYADFWELYKRNNLPEQTKNYVPEIIAAIIISKNPHQYGFDDIQFDPAITYDTVPINYSVDLRLVADIVDAQPQEMAEMNPSLLRTSTPPASLLSEPFSLHVPAGTAKLFQQRIAEIPEDRRTSWRYHRVGPDDSLASLARSFRVSVDQLASVNQLHSDDDLSNVEAVVIPQPITSTASTHVDVYKAHRGDTLVTVADRFGVSLSDLHRWNSLSGTTLIAGQRIRVTEPARVAVHTRAHGNQTKQTAREKSATIASSKNKKHTSATSSQHASASQKAGNSKASEVHPKKKSKKK